MDLGIKDTDLEDGLHERLLGENVVEEIVLPKLSETFEIESKESPDGYKDMLFSFAFLAHLLIIVAIAISYGAVALSNDTADFWIVSTSGEQTYDPSYEHMPEKFVFGLFLCVCFAAVLSVGWVYFLAHTATYVVYSLILSIVTFSIISGLSLLSMGYTYFSMPLIVTAVVTLLVALLYQDRITFASINLQTACTALLHTPQSIFLSMVVLLAQIVYTVIWCIALVGYATNAYDVTYVYDHIYYHMDQCDSYTYYSTLTLNSMTLTCDKSVCYACICDDHMVSNSKCMRPRYYLYAYVFFLLSLYWTYAVLGNILHVTTAGMVWDWWRFATVPADRLSFYLSKACTTSLGSICIGSLMSALVRITRTIVQGIVFSMDQRHAHHNRFRESRLSTGQHVYQYTFHLLSDLLLYLDKIVGYFNRYALSLIAMDGTSYFVSAQQALILFSSKGLDTLLNNDILDTVINIYIMSVSFACMALAYIYSRYVFITRIYTYLLVIASGLAGYVVSATILAPVLASIVAIYVSFARDPQSFEVSAIYRACMVLGLMLVALMEILENAS